MCVCVCLYDLFLLASQSISVREILKVSAMFTSSEYEIKEIKSFIQVSSLQDFFTQVNSFQKVSI